MIWLAIAICLLCAFVFSGIEAGILSVSRVRLKHRVKMRDPAAERLKDLLTRPERFLVTVIVVTNLMSIAAVTLTTEQLVAWMGYGGYWVALALFLPVNLFLLEVLPKSLFRRFPYRALATLSEPLRLADLLLTPLHLAGEAISRRFLRTRPEGQQKLFIAREDFKHFTVESERVGTLTPTERQMIHNVIDFRSVTARQTMLPMGEARTVPGRTVVSELLERGLETGIERWPVTNESGAITGLVDTFDLVLDARRTDRVEVHQRRVVRVAPNEPAYAVLRKLRAARIPVAIVGEPGAEPLGLLTLSELIRRLVDTASAKS